MLTRKFDGFTLEIIDSDWLTKPQEYNVSLHVQSLDIKGLRPSTDYIGYLYGAYKGSRTTATSIVASTGILTRFQMLVPCHVGHNRYYVFYSTYKQSFIFYLEVKTF
uniref:Uncharacterized protein n=1 Tax=Neogobius melanostomus TaxID=47308 RepID=A0A8C6UZ18_9GOBI